MAENNPLLSIESLKGMLQQSALIVLNSPPDRRFFVALKIVEKYRGEVLKHYPDTTPERLKELTDTMMDAIMEHVAKLAPTLGPDGELPRA